MQNDGVAQRREYRRKKARKKHLKAFFAVFLIFAILVAGALSVTVLFPIKKVIAGGSKIYEHSQIEKVSKLAGENIFVFSKNDLERRLKKELPYIESVKVQREFPDTVKVTVTDASDYASYKVGNKYYSVSKSGNVLCEADTVIDGTFEVITNDANLSVGLPVDFKNETVREGLQTIIDSLESNGITPEYIDFSDRTNITLGIMGRFKVILGGNSNLQKKCAHLNGMIKNIAEGEKGTINLSMWSSEKSEGTFIKDIK